MIIKILNNDINLLIRCHLRAKLRSIMLNKTTYTIKAHRISCRIRHNVLEIPIYLNENMVSNFPPFIRCLSKSNRYTRIEFNYK